MARRGRTEFDKSANIYFVTTTVSGFVEAFSIKEKYYEIMLGSVKSLLIEHSAILIAYVFMPNHVHEILYMPEGESISDLMRDFKRFTSTEIRKDLELSRENVVLDRLTKLSQTGKFKLWMDRFDCQVIYTQKTLETKINYIHFNPVKAGLVKEMTDWKYSSVRNYYLGDHSLIKVATDWTFDL